MMLENDGNRFAPYRVTINLQFVKIKNLQSTIKCGMPVFLFTFVNSIIESAYLIYCNYYHTHLCNKRSVLCHLTYLITVADWALKKQKPVRAECKKQNKIYAKSW